MLSLAVVSAVTETLILSIGGGVYSDADIHAVIISCVWSDGDIDVVIGGGKFGNGEIGLGSVLASCV